MRRRRSADEETDFITAVVEHVYIVDYSTYSSNLIPRTGMYNNKAINTVIYVTFLSLIVSKILYYNNKEYIKPLIKCVTFVI